MMNNGSFLKNHVGSMAEIMAHVISLAEILEQIKIKKKKKPFYHFATSLDVQFSAKNKNKYIAFPYIAC